MKMIILKRNVLLIFLFSMIISAIPRVTSTLDETEHQKLLPRLGLENILEGSTSPKSEDVINSKEKHIEEDKGRLLPSYGYVPDFLKIFWITLGYVFDIRRPNSNMRMDNIIQITSKELKKELDGIKESISRLYENTKHKSEEDLYLTKVGVSKPIITNSPIKIESKEMRERRKVIPRGCLDVLRYGNNISGVYQIQPVKTQKPFMVLCDMDIRGGGWTHIQKRFDGSVDFLQGWREYKMGFGDLLGEFWIGLEHIRSLTSATQIKLLIELVDRDNVTTYAEYDAFGIGPEPGGYQLEVLSGYSGDAGDHLTGIHSGMKFTTIDLDQDQHAKENCAVTEGGGWWFRACGSSNLNGKFINIDNKFKGVQWQKKAGDNYPYSKVRMLVKPARG